MSDNAANAARVERGRKALAAAYRFHERHTRDDDLASDVITDLMHFLSEHGHPAEEIVERALAHYRDEGARMPLTLTRPIAWAIATDDATRQMRAHGRGAWNEEDANMATRRFQELWPVCRDVGAPCPDICDHCKATMETHNAH